MGQLDYFLFKFSNEANLLSPQYDKVKKVPNVYRFVRTFSYQCKLGGNLLQQISL